jgi:hydroxyacyl-ACP dehydratase HTD2-like protein with hotdog domain
MSEWSSWVGRSQESDDVVTPGLVARYRATLDRVRAPDDRVSERSRRGPHARDAEGFDGLVVQGPLTASLLLDLVAREIGAVTGFAFRGEGPAFAGRPLTLCGRREGDAVALAAFDDAGVRVMSASART